MGEIQLNQSAAVTESPARLSDVPPDFYRQQLERVSKFIEEQIHPWYGSCDGFANSQCSECVRVLTELKAAYQKQHATV